MDLTMMFEMHHLNIDYARKTLEKYRLRAPDVAAGEREEMPLPDYEPAIKKVCGGGTHVYREMRAAVKILGPQVGGGP